MIKFIKKYKTIITLGFLATLSLGVFFYTQAQGGGQTNSSPNLQKGLVGHWSMDEMDYSPTTNTIKDLSAYANHGTNYGATFTDNRLAQENHSLSFNGSSNYIDAGASAVLNTGDKITVSAWIKPKDVSANTGDLVSKYGTGGYSFTRYFNHALFFINDPSNYLYAHSVFNLDEWVHIVYTADNYMSGKTKIISYVNGAQFSNAERNVNLIPSTNNFYIGGKGRYNKFHNGLIDDVRVYNRVLSQEEISLLYESYKPQLQGSSLEKGLIAHWSFSDLNFNSNTNQFKDHSPYGFDLVNYGSLFTEDRQANSNAAISLNGTSNYLLTSNNINRDINAGDWTATVWYMINTEKPFHSWKTVFGTESNYTTGFNIFERRVCSYTKTAYAFCVNFDTNMSPYTWHFVTTIHDFNAKKISVYLDGQYVGQSIYTGELVDTTNRKMGLGRQSPSTYFNGNISEARLYNRILSETEIKQLYESHKPQLQISSLQKGLVLDMPLKNVDYNATTNRVDDKSVYGNHGANFGATIGEGGGVFDGSNYVQVNGNNLQLDYNDEFTASIWFKVNGVPADGNVMGLFGRANGGRWAIDYYFPANQIRYCVRGSAQLCFSQDVNEPDEWNLATMIYKPAGILIGYLNGVKVIEQNISSDFIVNDNIVMIANANAAGGGSPRNFIGDVNGAKIYNRALSAEEVDLLYSLGR